MRVFYGRTVISIVAMQCVFCLFWQDIDIKCSDAMRVLWQHNDVNYSDAMRVFSWRDDDIIGSDAVRVLCILAGQRYQL